MVSSNVFRLLFMLNDLQCHVNIEHGHKQDFINKNCQISCLQVEVTFLVWVITYLNFDHKTTDLHTQKNQKSKHDIWWQIMSNLPVAWAEVTYKYSSAYL